MQTGILTKNTFHSDIYPGTIRDYWLYIPEQYTPETPANLMVIQDGFWYLDDPEANAIA